MAHVKTPKNRPAIRNERRECRNPDCPTYGQVVTITHYRCPKCRSVRIVPEGER